MNIELGNARLLVLLIEVAAMAFVALKLARWRHEAQQRFAGGQASRLRWGHAWPGTLLLLVAAVLIVIAAARPQWGSEAVEREREGIELVIALDISQSMQAADVGQTRLALAQSEITRLLDSQRGSRIGLVYFAGSALVRSPLSTDTGALSQLISRADIEGGLVRSGSDLGAALDQASNIFDDSETEGKALLVVSDGEDHPSTYASRIEALRQQGVAIFTAGVGTPEGSTIAERDIRTGQSRVKLDASGAPIITRLNETNLRALSDAGGGRYVRLGVDGMVGLAPDFAALAQTPLGAESSRILIERFQYFAGAAFVLLIVAWLLPERVALPFPQLRPRRLRPSPALSLLLAALLVGGCSGGADPLREENARATALYDAGDFEAALAAYQELLSQRPDVPELSYNVGNTLNRLGSYDRAVVETQRALPPTEDKQNLGVMTFFALGNHFFALNQLDQAALAYRNALLLDPTDEDAKFNLELTLLRLQAMMQPPPPPQQGDGPQGESPQPGDQPQPQPSQPQPGPTPQAGEQQGQQPGQQPPQPGQGQPTADQLRRSLEEALRGLNEEISAEDAIQILDLLRQQQERAPTGPAGAPNGPDY